MARVVKVPVSRLDPAASGQVREKRRAGVRRQNVKRGRRDPSLDGPVYGAGKDVWTISVQAEDETAVDQNAETVEPPYHLAVATAEVLTFSGGFEPAAGKRFESYEETSQACRCGVFYQIIAQDRVDGCGCLKDAAH